MVSTRRIGKRLGNIRDQELGISSNHRIPLQSRSNRAAWPENTVAICAVSFLRSMAQLPERLARAGQFDPLDLRFVGECVYARSQPPTACFPIVRADPGRRFASDPAGSVAQGSDQLSQASPS